MRCIRPLKVKIRRNLAALQMRLERQLAAENATHDQWGRTREEDVPSETPPLYPGEHR